MSQSEHVYSITGDEVAERLRGILASFGVKILITDATVSALFPDGAVAFCQRLHLDTDDL